VNRVSASKELISIHNGALLIVICLLISWADGYTELSGVAESLGVLGGRLPFP